MDAAFYGVLALRPVLDQRHHCEALCGTLLSALPYLSGGLRKFVLEFFYRARGCLSLTVFQRIERLVDLCCSLPPADLLSPPCYMLALTCVCRCSKRAAEFKKKVKSCKGSATCTSKVCAGAESSQEKASKLVEVRF